MFQTLQLPNRGLSAVSTRPIQKGETILQDIPLITVVDYSSLSQICHYCFRITQTNKHHSYSQPLFCSEKCQLNALQSTLTQTHLKALEALEHHPLFNKMCDDYKHAAVFILKAKLIQNSQIFSQILSHSNCMKLTENELNIVKTIHNCVSESLQPISLDFEITSKLYIIDKCNSFAFSLPIDQTDKHNRHPRGYAFYLHATVFNHSCLPNCVRTEEIMDETSTSQPLIEIRVLSDITLSTELTISYVPLNTDYETRAKRLLEEYGFECDCERCAIERLLRESSEVIDENLRLQMVAQAIYLIKYVCSECGGTLCSLMNSMDQKCNVCGLVRSEEEFQKQLDQELNDSGSEMEDNVCGDEDI